MPSTSTDRIDGLSTSVAVKAPVKAVSSANLTLSGEQTVNGVAVVDGDRVLVKDQNTGSENGIYVVSTGSWSRAKDFDGNRDVRKGTLVVYSGSTNIYYRVTNDDPIVIGTTEIVFQAVAASQTAESISEVLNARTAAEIAASVTPVDYAYPEGTVNRYGKNTTPGTTDMTAAINAAISVGGSVFFLGETYAAQGITADQDYQMFFGQAGTVVKKNANGTLMTVSGNRCGMFNIRFDGNGATYTGSNIVKSGVHLAMLHCSSYAAASRAVMDSDGNGLRIAGTNHVYQTLGATSSDYDIEIAGSGLYAKITDIYTSQSTGGIYVNGASGVSIVGGQFGKLTVLTGWAQVVNCRINGDTRIEGSNTQMVNTSHSADVTIGDGSTALSGIIWSPSCIIQSGSTFTVTAGVVDSVIYTEQLTANGATVDLTNISSDNEFYTAWAAYTPTIGAAGGSPTIGNGTITAYAKRRGRVFDASIRLICGNTTDFGTGAITLTMPYIPSSTVKQHGSALLLDAGTQFYTAIGETLADGTSAINILPQAASAVTLNVPFTWTTSDEIRLSMVGVEA